jgi:hypothetical protein
MLCEIEARIRVKNQEFYISQKNELCAAHLKLY